MIAIVLLNSPQISFKEGKNYIDNFHCAHSSPRRHFRWSASPAVMQRGCENIVFYPFIIGNIHIKGPKDLSWSAPPMYVKMVHWTCLTIRTQLLLLHISCARVEVMNGMPQQQSECSSKNLRSFSTTLVHKHDCAH